MSISISFFKIKSKNASALLCISLLSLMYVFSPPVAIEPENDLNKLMLIGSIGPDETPKLTILPFGAKHLIPFKKVFFPTES